MRWLGRRQSSNVEDRRGLSRRGIVGGGIGTIVIALIAYLLGGDPSSVIESVNVNQQEGSEYVESAEEKELSQFTAVVLAETEDVWGRIFQQEGSMYDKPTLVLFNQSVESACGLAGSATGPFYCPGDQKVYIDLSFFNELQNRFKAPGDFAMAYVIAHEVGHHIQNILGVTDQMGELRQRLNEEEFNRYSVRVELQADFYAGVWAHYTERNQLLEEGDIDEALNAASAVGDDRIQKSTQGYIVPESFTHGTSGQRKRWFYKGFTSGDINQGNTFQTENL